MWNGRFCPDTSLARKRVRESSASPLLAFVPAVMTCWQVIVAGKFAVRTALFWISPGQRACASK